MSTSKNPKNTPTKTLTYLTILLLSLTNYNNALNITQILSHFPDLSEFNNLLTQTDISTTLTHRTSLTILAVPNKFLNQSPPPTSPSTLADVIRYHVLLQYLTWSDLRHQPQRIIPTLLQTENNIRNDNSNNNSSNIYGQLNLTFNQSNGVVSFHPINNISTSSNVIELVKIVPFQVSIFTVDSLIMPYDFNLMASETRPFLPSINITKALIDGHDFNVAASMLMASGVNEEFEKDELGAGVTFFVPTDVAFANLPSTVNLQELPAGKKSLVLKFHVLHSYYPLGSLESIVNPVQPTLATEDYGAGSFTLNISRVNGSVAINTGLVQAVVTQTVFDQNPVAIFGVSNVLLAKEIFGKGSEVEFSGGSGGGPLVAAQPPSVGLGPVTSQDVGPSRLSMPPVVSSNGLERSRIGGCLVVVLCCCVGGLFLLL